MTESEAKQRWCPFAREVCIGANPSPASYNRTEGHPSERAMCLGSGCMAWRWREKPSGAVPYNKGSGYCGIAGKAEAT